DLQEPTMRIRTRCSLVGLVVAAMVPVVGCGGATVKPIKVEGVVTLDGQPLPGATVSFLPNEGGRTASGRSDADGSFRLTTFNTDDGALPGEYKVIVTVVKGDEEMMRVDPHDAKNMEKVMMRNAMQHKDKNKKKEAVKKKSPSPLPETYSDMKQTPLKV